MKLKLKGVRVLALTKYPGENGTTQFLQLAGVLTPPVARKLKIGECYNEDGVPHTWDVYPSPAVRVNGGDVFLGDKEYHSTLIHKFRITQPKTGGDNDTSLEIRFRAHFTGKEPLAAWLDRQNKTEFPFSLNARQEDFDFGDGTVDDEDGQEDLDLGCVSCNNGVEMGINNLHVNGQKCTNPKNAKESTAPLASAREAEGKTPGRAGKKGAVAQMPDPAVN